MKSLLFIILAGYAVRSDSNEYYVIEMPDDPPIQLHTKKPFKVYWNVPTMQCSSKKIYFNNLFEDFGIIQNDNDRFKGEKNTILYDPGLFPALFKNETSGNFRLRNGGVPQEGDLNKHLDEFRTELDRSIPNKNFSGVGIIDFESWRPIFRQNFGTLQPYKDFSIEIEKKLHWWWNKSWIQAEAKRRFEEAARLFMQSTLSVAKQLRPLALWGFYGFPYCFNMASNNMVESCADNVSNENDQANWLWSDSTALFPSVYSPSTLSTSQLVSLIRGRVKEAARCAKTVGGKKDILPYIWFRYRDGGFLSQADLTQALSTLYKSEATGMMIWGSSNDVNTVAKCNKLLTYVQTVLGPAIAKYTKPPNRLNDDDNDTVSTTTTASKESHVSDDTSNTTPDPGYNLNLAENNTDDIKSSKQKEIIGYLNLNGTKYTSQNNSILIDLILNTVLDSLGTTTTDSPNRHTEIKNEPSLDLVSSTTELNVKATTTETSQTTSKAVTDTSLLNEVNHTSPRENLESIDIPIDGSSGSADTTTTENFMDAMTDKIQSTREESRFDFVTKITTTEENVYITEYKNHNDPLKKINRVSANHFDTLDKETSTIMYTDSVFSTKIETNLGKNEKKTIVSTKNTLNEDIETTVKYDHIENETTSAQSDIIITKKELKSIVNENFNDFSTEKSETNESNTEFIITTPVSTALFTHTTDEIVPSTLRSTHDTSSYLNEFTTEYLSNTNSTTSATISDISNDTDLINSQESETTNSTNVKEASIITDKFTESVTPKIRQDSKTSQSTENPEDNVSTSPSPETDTSKTVTSEETSTTVVPTSTIQVIGSATRLQRSYLYCFLFFIIYCMF